MRNYFLFDNEDSRDYGVYISGSGTYDAPEREYQTLPVPGRNGDLLSHDKRLSNITVTYPAFICTNFRENMAAFRSLLLSRTGYKRLEDTYHPEEFRRAFYRGDLRAEVRSFNDAAQFELSFECDPRRFLKLGESKREFTAAGAIINPTEFSSKPLIRVYGYGTLGIGFDIITIAQGNPYTDIDCEIMDCYYGTTNANSLVTFSSNNFPELAPGSTGISLAGNITKIEITPRWWRV